MSGLPLPSTTTKPQHGKAQGLYRLARSKRGLSLLLALFLTSLYYIFDAGLLINGHVGSARVPAWPQLGGLGANSVTEESSTPLTSLGLEADRSFRLGDTSKAVYKTDLEQFVARAFPTWLRDRAQASIELYLGDAAKPLTLPEVPHKIYQTAKKEPKWTWSISTWRNIPGYTYFFFDDGKADEWVRAVFGGTEIEKVWDVLGPGIKVSSRLTE
jgi:hypothetical protein